MSGWVILSASAVCAGAVLLFLKLVADEIAATREGLRLLEQREERAYRERQAAALKADEIVAEVASE